MATNGNELQQQLQATRDPKGPAVVDDLAVRVADVVTLLREISRYSSEYASNLESGLGSYDSHIRRLLGRIGK